MDLRFDPDKTALIVVDMQKDFYAPEGDAAKRGKHVETMRALPGKINTFVRSVEEKIGLIVFTKYISGSGITPENLEKVAGRNGYALSCPKSSGLEELEGVDVPKGAVVIEKTHFDAFAKTDLIHVLKAHSITTVLVAGVRTEICVDGTAKRAASEGFDTVIVSDLTATYDDKEDIHEYILSSFDKYYGYSLASKVVLTTLGA